MASTSETGHAINFEDLIQLCTGFNTGGVTGYNPTNPLITLVAMQTKFTATDAAIEALSQAKPPFIDAVNDRQVAFAGMKKRVTRVVNAFKAIEETTDRQYRDAMTIVYKIRGERVKKVDPESEDSISVSQQSFDQQYNHFRDFVNYITGHAFYTPNETALQTAALTAMLADLRAKNKAATTTAVPYRKALNNRNKVMYAKKTGLVDVAIESKDYVKSAFEGGASSPEYALVKGINFRNIR